METLQQQPSFEQLLDRARQGCTSSAGELLETFRGYLLVVANGQLDGQLRVKFGGSDLVQQTLMNAHREFGQFRGRSERELFAWLQRILINEVARVRRDYRMTAKRDLAREVPLDPSDASHQCNGGGVAANLETPSHYAMAREDQERVRSALASLSHADRNFVELRNRDFLTFSDIGARLGMSTEGARRAWSAAVERLRLLLLASDET